MRLEADRSFLCLLKKIPTKLLCGTRRGARRGNYSRQHIVIPSHCWHLAETNHKLPKEPRHPVPYGECGALKRSKYLGVEASAGKGKDGCHITSTSEMTEIQQLGLGTLPPTLKQVSVMSLRARLGTPCRTECQPASPSQPEKATSPAVALTAGALWTGQTQNPHARHHLERTPAPQPSPCWVLVPMLR